MTLIRLAGLLLALLVISDGARADRLQEKAAAKAGNDIEWKSYVFISWYDGWGKHSIWGIGTMQAASNDGEAMCNNKKVSIIPSYDTHADLKEPMPFQTREFAEAYNREILRLLRLQGIRCTFDLVD